MAIQFPTHLDYDTSIKGMDKLVLVPQLKGGIPIKNKKGGFFSFSGGFAKVYRIKSYQGEYALRCWLAEQPDIQKRYKMIKEFTVTTPLSYFINFDYFEKGIIAISQGKSQPFPVICMEWVPDPTLGKYVKNNLNNPDKLLKVAEAFLEMVANLHANSIAHGDLQVGNIIVKENNGKTALKLIDYDSLYIPKLVGLKNYVGGVEGFQSPFRPEGFFNERMDYFSELVIYLSLEAFSQNKKLCSCPDEILLFNQQDLSNPDSSKIFTQLNQLSENVKKLSFVMRDYCKTKDINQLLPLEKALELVTSNKYQSIHRVGKGSSVNSSKPPLPPVIYPSNSTVIKPRQQKSDRPPVITPPILKCSVCGERISDSKQIYCSKGHQLSTQNIICPYCKKLIPSNAVHCPRCGKKQ